MKPEILYLLILLAAAIVLDILFVRGMQKYRRLKKEATDPQGNRKISEFELLKQAFLGGTPGKRSDASRQGIFESQFTRSQIMSFALEWLLIVAAAYFYCGDVFLDFNPDTMQQSGEQSPSATLPWLTEIGLHRYGEIPLWNPYMLTGFPHTGDPLGHFWHPISTIAILLWGAIVGMKVSIFLAFVLAGLGQWTFAYVLGLRRTFRLWSAILFMLSGGLAMLWRVGWYELLLGAAWFPWCFALYIHALRKNTIRSIVLMSIAVFMVISTGGGYYPFYLLGCLITLFLTMFLSSPPQERFKQIRTSIGILLFSTALSAVVILPYTDVFPNYGRDVVLDDMQRYSQPIEYGLINFIVYTPDWFYSGVLGAAGGWNWFYIGWLPIAAFAFLPLAWSQASRIRKPILISGLLLVMLLMWFANRYTIFSKVFDWFPYLYNLRFPNRLLVIATSPLLILSALGLEHAFRLSKVIVKDIKFVCTSAGKKNRMVFAHLIVAVLWVLLLVTLTKPVYDVNQTFAFVDQTINPKPVATLRWLKEYDPSLYYVNIGGGQVYWEWTAAAYQLEIPMINFLYSRHLRSQEVQRGDASPFMAQAKYQISLESERVPPNSTRIHEVDGIVVWRVPGVLPYAFSAQPEFTRLYTKLTTDKVTPVQVRLNGPNQVIAKGAPSQAGDVLVVLMSYFPGWKLWIDGQPADLVPVNGYLGTTMLPGEHTYQFYFLPAKYLLGAVISSMTLLIIIMILFPSPIRFVIQKISRRPEPGSSPDVTP